MNDDDDGEGNNFSFEYGCEAGKTYYIAVREYDYETGSPYRLNVELIAETTE